jgi:two-component sensor histidine kinase
MPAQPAHPASSLFSPFAALERPLADSSIPFTRPPRQLIAVTNGEARIPRIWWFISAAWLVPALLATVSAYLRALGSGEPVDWREPVWEGGDWLLYAIFTPVVLYMGARFPLRGGGLARKIPLHLITAFSLCMLWAGTGTILRRIVMPDTGPISWDWVVTWSLITLPFGTAVYFSLLGVEHGIHYFMQVRERERQLAEARLGALRMQIQPHFLLNSLNAITVLVRDRDTPTATRMLEELGEVLRRVLRSDRGQEVPLADEIDFLQRYLAIEQVRFPDRLRFVLDVDPAVANAAVPDFILQPLVENAIRHGIARRADAGELRIIARREGNDVVISVIDDGPGPDAEERQGVGLANTRERLRTLYGDHAKLELAAGPGGRGAAAVIRMPFRKVGDRRNA